VGKFVLFAEDDCIQTRFLAAVCKKLAIPPSDFAIVEHGGEAIAICKRSLTQHRTVRKPDLIITDCQMSVVDGLDLLKWVRETDGFRRIPLIILTNNWDEKTRKIAEDLRCNGLFQKPVGLSKMAQMIKYGLPLCGQD
jgi:CheY-like chemotaxis protein